MLCIENKWLGFASVLTLLVIGLPFSVVPAVGQCCGGAQNSVSHSHDGRFRVEAMSLTGTGHHNHGPYKFRFRTLRIGPNEETEEIGVFERAWDTDSHFSMTVCVSPTGNGFALGSSLEDPILFFSPKGTILAKLDNYLSPNIHCRRKSDPPGVPAFRENSIRPTDDQSVVAVVSYYRSRNPVDLESEAQCCGQEAPWN